MCWNRELDITLYKFLLKTVGNCFNLKLKSFQVLSRCLDATSGLLWCTSPVGLSYDCFPENNEFLVFDLCAVLA